MPHYKIEIEIIRATGKEINIASNILNQLDGKTDSIKLRIYNCNNTTLENIESNYNVTNVGYIS